MVSSQGGCVKRTTWSRHPHRRLVRFTHPAWTILLAGIWLFSLTATGSAADWPAYRHDNHRSGATPESIAAESLGELWAYRSSAQPQPAWAGPAKWDAYHEVRGLRSMRDYDAAFHLVSVGDLVLFGSSGDDSVRALDAASGEVRWCFTTDAPIRMAPAIADGRVYFGSDDGFAYCLDLPSGSLIWKRSPSFSKTGPERRILNDGRLISPWPCRTGVLVDGGTAYFSAGMLPWRDSFFSAVDALTGQPEGSGRYENRLPRLTMEGPLLASESTIFVAQGRVPPLMLNRKTGRPAGSLKGGGGSFVLLTDDDNLLHGPGNKTGWITQSSTKTRQTLATFNGANAMVVSGSTAYILTDDRLFAIDRPTKRMLWETACECPYELILAGKTLFAGGRDRVTAFDTTNGTALWHGDVIGRAYSLAVAGGRLLASTDEGAVHCFTADGTPKKAVPAAKVEGPAPSNERPQLPVPRFDDDALLGRWVFQGEGVQGSIAKDQAGRLNGSILGKATLEQFGDVEGLLLDGQDDSVLLTDDHRKARLPQQQITAEAWVRVDKPLKWGGIVGCVQDNGSYERGWILGYTDNRFTFAVAAKDGPGRLTYLKSDTDFQPGRGYHLVGTYDGAEMRLYVDGRLAASSTEQRGPIDYPPQAFYEIGAYHDKDEYFHLSGLIHEVRVYGRAISADEAAEHHRTKKLDWPPIAEPAEGIKLAMGPYLEFTDPRSAIVIWHTERPSPTILDYGSGADSRRIEDTTLKQEHQVTLNDLRKNTVYQYTINQVIDGKQTSTKPFECDTFFNYTRPAITDTATRPGQSGFPIEREPFLWTTSIAKTVAFQKRRTNGIALVAGCGNGQACYHWAQGWKHRVIGVDTNAKKVAALRREFLDAGIYGNWITVHHVDSYDRLPTVGSFADALICEGLESPPSRPVMPEDEIRRLCHPGIGFAFLRTSDSDGSALPNLHEVNNRPPEGDGVWTHQYGLADNSTYGGESLGGARSTDDLEVQWIGRPGPRMLADRQGRKPSPLALGHNLFVQGLHRIIAIDVHNGTIHWSLEIPVMERFNIPHDCSNWCAGTDIRGTDGLYVAINEKCWQIDAESGAVVDTTDVVPGERAGWSCDWGYVAMPKPGHLLGSAVKAGTSWTSFWGGEAWYDAKSGETTYKICSENLFSLNPGGRVRWTYTGGLIINSTIAATETHAYFVECRNQKVIASESRRVGMPELWQDQFLVALDLETGKKVWERPIDTVDGTIVFYLAAGDGKLVMVASNKKYHVYAYNAADGADAWNVDFDWAGKDHGGHISTPAIVGGKVIVRPRVIDLETGQLSDKLMPHHKCGTHVVTDNAVIYRLLNLSMWDIESGTPSGWNRLRSSCWISTIPACGMLLSPEGGGGCSCGSWLETSVGFVPKSER